MPETRAPGAEASNGGALFRTIGEVRVCKLVEVIKGGKSRAV